MDALEFSDLRASLPYLLELDSLVGTNPDIRPDSLPQNWIDDMVRLSPEQRETLAGDIPGGAPAWALALRDLLLSA